jgi:L-fuculose-phosphate aldolase
MRRVVTAREVEDLLRSGGSLKSLPADAIYTPSARDLILDAELRHRGKDAGHLTDSANDARHLSANDARHPGTISSKSPRAEIDALFASAKSQSVKEQICEVGRRLWMREYVDGNGGNIAVRVGSDLAICTPTLVSKGFMKPEDMCLVDFEGNQLCGSKGRTSEILMHLQIMARQPKAVATVHCHPPYATGFAVVGLEPPTCMIPEYEVFSSVALAEYRTPGTPEMGKLVADLVDQHNTVLMANHGVVSWSPTSVEDAYMKMEILEAYCRTVLVTAQLGKPPNTFTAPQMQDLLRIKQNLNIPDPRIDNKDEPLCDNSAWSPGVQCAVPAGPGAPPSHASLTDAERRALVEEITNRILEKLK